MSEEQKNALTLSGFLSEDRILILSGKQEKDDVLNALIETLAEVPEIDGRDDVARGSSTGKVCSAPGSATGSACLMCA